MKNIITLENKKYPKLLREVGKKAPKQLYYKGEWSGEIFENCLAVVGSRRMTSYGRQITERIVNEAASQGLTIVSGFMYGVDATAHKAALSAAKKSTIAVMPCGIDLVHPEYQQDLYDEILNSRSLIVSEYEADFAPVFWTYPQRNRIVAGLSKAVLVVEAGENSGSLITASWAKKFGRKIFVVPGPITSENSKGIMQLIREGATPIDSAKDILDYYQLKKSGLNKNFVRNSFLKNSYPSSGFKNPSSSSLENQIIEQLQREAMDIDALARIFGASVSALGTTLSLMQLKGEIKQEGNKYYIQ